MSPGPLWGHLLRSPQRQCHETDDRASYAWQPEKQGKNYCPIAQYVRRLSSVILLMYLCHLFLLIFLFLLILLRRRIFRRLPGSGPGCTGSSPVFRISASRTRIFRSRRLTAVIPFAQGFHSGACVVVVIVILDKLEIAMQIGLLKMISQNDEE